MYIRKLAIKIFCNQYHFNDNYPYYELKMWKYEK